MKAIVCFHNDGCHPFNFILKKGFKHCMIAVLTGEYWVEIDWALAGYFIKVKTNMDYDLAKYYRSIEGWTIIETEQVLDTFWMTGNILVRNCVGQVKMILGLKGFAFTPYMLYKQLKGDTL